MELWVIKKCYLELLMLNSNTWNYLTVCKQMQTTRLEIKLPTSYSWPSRLGPENTLTVSLQTGKIPSPTSVLIWN